MKIKKINCFILFSILIIPFKMSYADIDSANQHALSILMNEFKIAKKIIYKKDPKTPWKIPSIINGNFIKLFVAPNNCNISIVTGLTWELFELKRMYSGVLPPMILLYLNGLPELHQHISRLQAVILLPLVFMIPLQLL